MKDIINEIESFSPKTLKQYLIQEDFIAFIQENNDSLLRSNLKGHLTSSAFVVDKNARKVLLIHHKKLDKWLQPGGHCDGDPDLLKVAVKEVYEETGLKIKLKGQTIKGLDIHVIPEYKGIPEHKHYDVRFIFESDSSLPLIQNKLETTGLQWVLLNKLIDYMDDPSVINWLENECYN